jgi:5'-3' exonuclease
MPESAPKLLLLDTASLYFRAFYGVPDSVRAPDGRPANAIRGLLDFIAQLTVQHDADQVVACWDDDWRPAFRVALIPSYKAHRVVEVAVDGEVDAEVDVEEVPDTLAPQVDAIAEVLDAYGIARVGWPGHEADDVIGTLAVRHDGPVDIVTGDRDLFQLVHDERPIRVLYTSKGVRAADVIDEAAITAKYGIPGRSYAVFAALRGDPSDGLPGVRGVGEKTAAAIVNLYPTYDALLAAIDAEDPDLPAAKKLIADRAYLDLAPRVVDVVKDLPIPQIDAAIPAAPRDPARVEALSAEWGLTSPLARVADAFAARTADRG